MKVLHFIAANVYSGAENVVYQIMRTVDSVFPNKYEMTFVAPKGPIIDVLEEKKIRYLVMESAILKEVKRVIDGEKPDIIHAHDPRMSAFCGMSSRGIPVVSHIHCNHPYFRKWTAQSIMYRLLMSRMSYIIWVSESALSESVFAKKRSY